jgi:dihydrofolate synthase/folylpolyglutamate synthase
VNFSQALDWLYGTQLHGIRPGLAPIRRLLDALGFDGSRQRFIHVAGTNGKGSVCAMLDAVCRAHGIRTALYTSPHLVNFRERIRIGGAMISENETAAGLTKIRDIIGGWETHPTFFEIATTLALDYFQNENADVVILETGLGGRLDATNVVTPRVSVITPIDLDHQAYLGDTLAQIAAEKAGIIKPRIPVVSAPQHVEAAAVLAQTAAEKNAPLAFITEPLENFRVNLAGSHQRLNAALALASLRAAKIEVPPDAIRRGLNEVEWPGRFQILGTRNPELGTPIVLDGAHNEAAAQRLVLTWGEVFGDERPAVILGVLADKDVTGVCRALLPLAAEFIACPVNSPRTAPPQEIARILRSLDAGAVCRIAESLAHAIALAAAKPRPILITGSLFLVGETLAHFDPAAGKPQSTAQ